MGAAREKDQADFDLERFVDLFDEAMTSKDPRVVETLRNLLMIVALTRPETYEEHSRRSGPLRRLFEDMHDLNRRVSRLDEELRDVRRPAQPYRWEAEDKYTMAAASNLAQSIDRDVMRELSKQTAMQINGGVWPKGTLK
jgi:hypothetical protein